jgi:hypothetical protein
LPDKLGKPIDARLIPPVLPPMIAAATNARTMWQLFKEFLLFLKQEKKWWLIPLVVLLLILGAIIVFSSGSVLAPLMYPFM